MITISTDKSKLDLDRIHRYLAEESYWAKHIPREVFNRSVEHALCFGAYDRRQQVGFARVISDFATFAYVADVFVVESHRGRGVSKMLMEAIRSHESLQGLRRWHLVTRDAHRLYEQYGFRALSAPERHMESVDPTIYERATT